MVNRIFPLFKILLEWNSGQLQEEESWKGNWEISVSKTVSTSLVEDCHPKDCSSLIQVYGDLPVNPEDVLETAFSPDVTMRKYVLQKLHSLA
jgi:hypothetical protein